MTGVGNVNYSGIFTLLTISLHAKGHIDLLLIASKPEGIPMMHYINWTLQANVLIGHANDGITMTS